MTLHVKHPRSSEEPVQVVGMIVRESERALLFDDGGAITWIPKSLVSERRDLLDGAVELTIPRFKAYELGLI